MFEQLLQMVKEQIGGNSQVSAAIPAEHADAVHTEIANQVVDGLKTQAAATPGGAAGLLSKIENELGSGGMNAIAGGLVGSLASKFGLPPSITGAITASLPGLLQRFAQKTNDPNDASISHANVVKALS